MATDVRTKDKEGTKAEKEALKANRQEVITDRQALREWIHQRRGNHQAPKGMIPDA